MPDQNAASAPVIVWFRQDLRLSDNPAYSAAASSGRPVIPVYILDQESAGDWGRGGASLWWLHHSLESLAASFAEKDLRLILRRGPADEVLEKIVKDAGAGAVFWNRCYEPWAIERDTTIKKSLTAAKIEVESYNGSLLFEPWKIKNKSGDPYRVFTPFWKACLQAEAPDEPLRAPAKVAAPDWWPASDSLEDWKLMPTKPDWAGGLQEEWTPGEDSARRRLRYFLDEVVGRYKAERDRPDRDSTSRLSPHLHFGEISPRQIWHATEAQSAKATQASSDTSRQKFLAEVGWREFSYHLLFQFPKLMSDPLQEKFGDFPWKENADGLRAWQKGQTGYPIVDAGMRQLWETGWMHNRVRMVVASFLIKDLLVPWQEGEAWFWDTLVDADLANNSASWQWVAGCGADAAPYFRVFNPTTQGEKFDPKGDYVRRYVPELADMPDKWIHKPAEAPDDVLSDAGITLGKTYPKPIVDHGEARKRALAAYEDIKGES